MSKKFMLLISGFSRISGHKSGKQPAEKKSKTSQSLDKKWKNYMAKHNIAAEVYTATSTEIRCNICSFKFNTVDPTDTERTYKYARDHQKRCDSHAASERAWVEKQRSKITPKVTTTSSEPPITDTAATAELDKRFQDLIDVHGENQFERIAFNKILCSCGKSLMLVSSTGDYMHNISQHMLSASCRRSQQRQPSIHGFFKKKTDTS